MLYLSKVNLESWSKLRFIDEETKVRGGVIVTSYQMFSRDVKKLFEKVNWSCFVIDEGHRIKDPYCKLSKEVRLIKVKKVKLLLTGTPLQNNLQELWGLLNFLMPEVFDDLRTFESWFMGKKKSNKKVTVMKESKLVEQLHAVLKPFLLRRLKADVDLSIPPKKEIKVFCQMSPVQRDLYEEAVKATLKVSSEITDEVEGLGKGKRKRRKIDYRIFHHCGSDAESDLDDHEKAKNGDESFNLKDLEGEIQLNGSGLEEAGHDDDDDDDHEENDPKNLVGKEVLELKHTFENSKIHSSLKVNLNNLQMFLRKIVNHPFLVENPDVVDWGFTARNPEQLVDICGKLNVMDKLLQRLLEKDHKVLIFSQMTSLLDILEDYLYLRKFNYKRLDGNVSIEDRQIAIDEFNNDEGEKSQVFLLSTRAGGLGINLTSADTCIIYDSDYNPQQDLQAQDRCHRFGQTRPVLIYRLITARTIDQTMVERADAKKTLSKVVIHKKKFKNDEDDDFVISPKELLDLLNSDDATVEIFNEANIDQLLDRTDLPVDQ